MNKSYLNGIIQKQNFVYIKPGSFMMGSPESEPGRGDDELMHEVILTKGFWLADTACTQELWEAVMGNNPSNFKGEHRPVENVSWNDCKSFLEKINIVAQGTPLRLPFESEWEYACRAGTTTPFSFGEMITPEQVNYHGEYPYNKGKKGKYRGETVDTKSLPCNGWGLYEMHGNVWEWCNDWYGEYPSKSVIDPEGPDSGWARVLRGGGWYDDGRGARSADRGGGSPDGHDYGIGFRFAR
jgi:sulfatase modifying factor 1